MSTVKKEFYTALVRDYIYNRENSVIYEFYLKELLDMTIVQKKKDTSPIIQTIRCFLSLSKDCSDNSAFEQILSILHLLVEHQELYNHALYLPSETILRTGYDRKTQTSEVKKTEDILNSHTRFSTLDEELHKRNITKQRKKKGLQIDDRSKDAGMHRLRQYLNDVDDYVNIQEAIWPFIEYYIETKYNSSETRANYLKASCKKTELHKDLCDALDFFVQNKSKSLTYFKSNNLLSMNNSNVKSLYSHILFRVIDDKFKEYLYCCKYRLVRKDSNAYDNSVDSDNDNFELKECLGRKTEKKDKTMDLLVKYCQKYSITSLFDQDYGDLYYRKLCQDLYHFLLSSEELDLNIPLAFDKLTGCSINLISKSFYPYFEDKELHKLPPYSFVVLKPSQIDDPLVYEIDSIENNDGIENNGTDFMHIDSKNSCFDTYSAAYIQFRIVKDYLEDLLLDQRHFEKNDFPSEELANTFTLFLLNPDSNEPSITKDEDNRKDVAEDLRKMFPDTADLFCKIENPQFQI